MVGGSFNLLDPRRAPSMSLVHPSPRIPKGHFTDGPLSPFVFDDLADRFILGQRNQDVRRIGTRVDNLGRLGVRGIESPLLLLGQLNGHSSVSLNISCLATATTPTSVQQGRVPASCFAVLHAPGRLLEIANCGLEELPPFLNQLRDELRFSLKLCLIIASLAESEGSYQ
jgi:hypothetical protein